MSICNIHANSCCTCSEICNTLCRIYLDGLPSGKSEVGKRMSRTSSEDIVVVVRGGAGGGADIATGTQKVLNLAPTFYFLYF